jgi:polar amino acid transport system substrate-binding protein
MGVKKGEQEMLNLLNAWISARAADKWLSATQKYWFTSLKWRDRVKPR